MRVIIKDVYFVLDGCPDLSMEREAFQEVSVGLKIFGFWHHFYKSGSGCVRFMHCLVFCFDEKSSGPSTLCYATVDNSQQLLCLSSGKLPITSCWVDSFNCWLCFCSICYTVFYLFLIFNPFVICVLLQFVLMLFIISWYTSYDVTMILRQWITWQVVCSTEMQDSHVLLNDYLLKLGLSNH